MIMEIRQRLNALSRSGAMAFSAAAIAGIYWLDILTGIRLGLLTFLWAPVALVTWICGLWPGLFYATSCVVLAVVHDIHAGRSYSHPFFLFWDILTRAVSFWFFVWILAKLRSAYEREGHLRRLSDEAARLKSSVVSLMSHEINNAITVLKMSVFLAQENEEDPSPALQESWRTISGVLLNMELAAKNFLDNARLESGKLALQIEKVDASALVDEVVRAFAPLFKRRSLTVIVDKPAGLLLAKADKAALSLILGNLVGNAVKYTRDGGRVTIGIAAAADAPGKLRVSVADTGIGIGAEDRRKLAAAFVRLPQGKLMAKGFGLGLKTVHDLLELHGSRLEIDSKLGKGSCFSFLVEAEGPVPELESAAPLDRAAPHP